MGDEEAVVEVVGNGEDDTGGEETDDGKHDPVLQHLFRKVSCDSKDGVEFRKNIPRR